MVHDGHGVGDGHEAKAVRDHQHCPVAPQSLHGIADEVFAGSVQVRGRLVEDDQPRAGEECPGEGDSLALPAAEPDPSSPTGVS